MSGPATGATARMAALRSASATRSSKPRGGSSLPIPRGTMRTQSGLEEPVGQGHELTGVFARGDGVPVFFGLPG